MSTNSRIEWTETTWNPVTGCVKISPGCKHCYAEIMAKRLQAMRQPNYKNGFAVTLQPHMLDLPYTWKKPRTIFVNSMSDLFIDEIPDEYTHRVFRIMNDTPQHTYQVLTKRSKRLAELSPTLTWSNNIWAGVTVESAEYAHRIDHLRQTAAAIKFLSLEPLLGPIPNIDLTGINWVIVGGESGPGARPMQLSWILDIKTACIATGTPFFFKQWGGVRKDKVNGMYLQGEIWNQTPLISSV